MCTCPDSVALQNASRRHAQHLRRHQAPKEEEAAPATPVQATPMQMPVPMQMQIPMPPAMGLVPYPPPQVCTILITTPWTVFSCNAITF